MAVIRSLAVGKSRKSAGDLTYQSYYGKVVAKQKIVANKSYVPSIAQNEQRGKQKYAGKAVHFFMPWIPQSFVRSKYGTKVNNFVKSNKEFLYSSTVTDSTYNRLQTYCDDLGTGKNFYFGRGLTNDFVNASYDPKESFGLSNTIPLVATSVKVTFIYAFEADDKHPKSQTLELTEGTAGSGVWSSGDFKIKSLFGAETGTAYVAWFIVADGKPLTCLNTAAMFIIAA
jgi:hypothetical protein